MAKIIGAPTLDDALSALREQIGENESRGQKTLVFCEDKLTLLAERAVLSAVGGTFLTEVTTFARYLSGPRLISKQGSVMLLSELIEEHGSELLCFRRGAAQAVYETIAQLSASRVSAELLRRGAEETEGMLKAKLYDLALLLEAYSARLKERGLLDESGYLALLPEKLSAPVLSEYHLIFFAFPSFTRQAQEGIRAALLSARSVTGVFLAGRNEYYTNEGARVFLRLCEELSAAEPSMIKSSLRGSARHLSEGLFSPEKLSAPPERVDNIRRFTAADEAEEYELIAALIKKHVFEGARYRDIALLVPGKESFFFVEKAFRAYRIPFFADKKRAFSEHPFCVFTLAILNAVSDGALPEESDAVASSVYFGRGENYRNYLMKFGGYRGAVRREIKEGDAIKGYNRAELVSYRERMLSLLSLFPKKGKGSVFTEGVRKLRSLVNEEETTQALGEYFTGAEREFLDLSPLDGLLAEIETLAGERVFTSREFADVLKNGLSALEISMIPQSADAVFVGDMTESKFERVSVLFAAGLTDALPRAAADASVISDREMEKLSALKVEIEPAIAQVNARARESMALNLCAFRDALYLSRPLKQGGVETERSEVLQYAEKLFEMPAMPALFPFDCMEKEPAEKKLLALKERYESGRGYDKKQYDALYAALAEEYGKERLERLLSGGKKERIEGGLRIDEGEVSPTLLENYFACPYAGFLTRGLKLREREERTVLDTDTGLFVHAVLEECAKQFNDLEEEDDCRALARAVGEKLIKTPRFSPLSDTAAGDYTAKQLISEGETVAAAAFSQLKGSAFRVAETEGKVKLPELGLSGKTDRIDTSGDYVRIIDYKTGGIDDTASAYYTGRKIQLELYLRAAARGKIAAGAFYFPAADNFAAEGEARFRMSGFYSGEEEVLRRMDLSLAENGEKSAFFDGKRDGKYTDKGMEREAFEAFLDYGVLLVQRAEKEMKAGNISPSPYEGVCTYCKMKSLCGFVETPRKEEPIKCAEIVRIVRREKGEI